MAHSKIGASSAQRWMNCPGSVAINAMVKDEGSSYAAEGTAAHALAEMCLSKNKAASSFLGEVVEGFEVTLDMIEAVQTYLDYVRRLAGKGGKGSKGDSVLIEHRFHLKSLHEDLFGTADFVYFNAKNKILHVVDYKHGAGIPVNPEANPQLMYYAMGAMLEEDFRPRSIVVTVVQPRYNHDDGPVRSWEISAIDMLGWIDDLLEAVKRTEQPDAPCVPGWWCSKSFCNGLKVNVDTLMPFCSAQEAYVNQAAAAAFETANGTVLEADVDKMGETLQWLDHVEQFIKNFRAFAYDEAVAGRAPTGFKLVDKRATRQWAKADADVITALHAYGMDDEDIFEKKLISPAKVEKVIGKAEANGLFTGLVEAVSSGTTLVPESDKRQKTVSGENVFD